MDEFFALARPEQQKRLDDIIDRMVQRSKERSQNPGRADRNVRGGQDRGRNSTEAQRDAWRKQRLDRSSPKERAQWGAFRQRLQERLEQRGINANSLPGRGGHGWRGMS